MIYDYKCNCCQKKFEVILPLAEYKQAQNCPECGSIAQKQMTLGGIQDDSPVWLNQSVRNQLQDTDVPHIPIETRTQYERHLKDNGIIPTN